VSKLAEFGIRDRNLWQLQTLVAAEIEALYRPAKANPVEITGVIHAGA
jgi:hypothetical protein